MNMSLADKLKELRKAKKVSQEKFADYLGVSYQAVSKWENGTTSPDISLLPDISRYFVTVDELLQAEKIDEREYYEECSRRSEELFRNGSKKTKNGLSEIFALPTTGISINFSIWLRD